MVSTKDINKQKPDDKISYQILPSNDKSTNEELTPDTGNNKYSTSPNVKKLGLITNDDRYEESTLDINIHEKDPIIWSPRYHLITITCPRIITITPYSLKSWRNCIGYLRSSIQNMTENRQRSQEIKIPDHNFKWKIPWDVLTIIHLTKDYTIQLSQSLKSY